jgi:type VI secretion system protein ImpG
VALKEILTLFSGASETAAQNAVRGLKSVDSRPVVRRISRRDGTGIGRGIEVTVTIDENAFDASEAFLFGAVLERFLAEYASVNTFTQTVIRGDRGVIMRWPPRIGARGLL